ncbi:hypothetical protein JMUB6875_54360 [Nocardia sp. JMUB6875]|uniref:ESX secretion-associated protein EspG n=1 Tax=Nocardia sp. JMUB6875 TaxID=3158170 RepID=UPI0032E7F2C3
MIWELTDDEFKLLCDRYLDGWMPVPLAYTSRTELYDDYRRELAALEPQLRERIGEGLSAAFEVVRDPEVFVISSTWCDSDVDNPDKRIRVHGAQRGHRAVMITMTPGETVYHSRGFTVTECEPSELPGLIGAQLPTAEAATGPSVPIVVEPEERDPYEVRQSFAFDSFDDSNDALSLAFWNRRADWTGFVRVLQGRSIYGPRGVLETTVLWRDLPGDGRYVIDMDEPEMRAVGASSQQLVDRIAGRVARVLEHMEARGEERV